MNLNQLKQNLEDAGCCDKVAKDIIKMYEKGNLQDVVQLMKKDRCRLMEELHDSGRKVDCMDFLIRITEKEIEVDADEKQ